MTLSVAVSVSPEFDAGDFKKGDRVQVTSIEHHHRGALGTVVKVDDADTIYPVVVWLDVFGKPTLVEQSQGFGLPLSASEIVKVAE